MGFVQRTVGLAKRIVLLKPIVHGVFKRGVRRQGDVLPVLPGLVGGQHVLGREDCASKRAAEPLLDRREGGVGERAGIGVDGRARARDTRNCIRHAL